MPTTQERIARVLLRVGVDRPALTDTKNQIDAFNRTLQDLERQKALSKLAQDSSRAVSEGKSLRAEMGHLKGELIKVGATSGEISKVVREFDRLNDAAERAKSSTGKGTTKDLLRSVGAEIRALPAVNTPFGFSTDVIGKVANTIGRVNVDLKTLAISGGLTSAAIIGVNLALENFRRTLEPVSTLIATIVKTRAELAGFLSTAAPADIVAQQKAAQDAVRQTSNSIIQLAQDFETSANNLKGQGEIGKLIHDLGTVFRIGPLGDILNEADRYKANLEQQQVVLNGLNAVLEENQRLLEQTTFDYAAYQQAITDKNFFSALQTELSLRKQSAASIRDNIAALEDEQRRLQDAFANQLTLGLSGEAVTKITDRLAEIGNLLPLYQQALPPAEARERLEAFAKGILEIPKAVSRATKLIEDVQKATAAIGELREEHGQRLADLQNRLRDQLSEAARDRDIALSEAARDAEIARSEAARKAGLERVEIERQSAKAIQQILRRANQDINAAIQDRNAVQLDSARERRREELRTERENRDERLRQLSIDLKEQNREIDRRLAEQSRAVKMRYDEQVRRAQIAAEKSIAVENARYNKELALKTQEVQRILGLEQQKVTAAINGATATQNITATFWQNMVTAARNAVSALASNAAKVVTPSGRPNASSGGKIPSMAVGGKILSDGLIFAHAGETVIPARNRNQSQGQIVFAPQINGLSKSAVKREIVRQLDQWADEVFR